MPAKATIMGKEVKLDRVTGTVTPSHDRRGFRRAASPLKIVLERKLEHGSDADTVFFEAAAKEPKRLDGENKITYVDVAGNDAYVISLEKAYVSRYQFSAEMRTETIEIFAGDASLQAGGDSSSFDLGSDFDVPK